mgnify:CR=1 FL=1
MKIQKLIQTILIQANLTKFLLSVSSQRFLSEAKQEWELLMAAATIFTTPIIVIFFIGQKYFIEGIATTGLK